MNLTDTVVIELELASYIYIYLQLRNCVASTYQGAHCAKAKYHELYLGGVHGSNSVSPPGPEGEYSPQTTLLFASSRTVFGSDVLLNAHAV